MNPNIDKLLATKYLVEAFLAWIRPELEREMQFLTPTEREEFLGKTTVGFGITYKNIVEAAAELGIETKLQYRVDTDKYKDL